MFKSFRAHRSLMANDLLQERIQHSSILGPTHPANYRDVMLHRKLVSEEVTVLDLWINHKEDREGGVEVSVTLLSCTQGMPFFWRIYQRVNKARWGPWELAAWRGVLWEWQVWWVEGWLRRVLWQSERGKKIEKRHCSTSFISNFGLIAAALYKSFEIPLWNNKLKVASVSSERIFDYHYKRRR